MAYGVSGKFTPSKDCMTQVRDEDNGHFEGHLVFDLTEEIVGWDVTVTYLSTSITFFRSHVNCSIVGECTKDHYVWERPKDMTMDRKAFKINARKPGIDVAGEYAAAMAVGSMVFKKKNTFHFSSYYYGDELSWGAVWLYMATNMSEYLTDAETSHVQGPALGQSWDEKNTGNMVILQAVIKYDCFLSF
ncbi:E3.2.1.4 [Mytilus coruscus]|uniref:cellulase n=1 Tax=Mytilus coruscus TaxID=42192 RepID=A0A6J8DXK5_MYTCO|nr:E3.2.1.4 [Mytilus coruscus]